MVTPTHQAKRRPFSSFLYWYTAWQLAFLVVIYGSLTVLMMLTYHGLYDYNAFVSLATGLDKYGTVISMFIAIPLCIAVATAHELGFWRGVGGYFVGNIVSTLAALPSIIALTAAGKLTNPVQIQMVFAAVSVVYGLIAGGMLWRRWPSRRQAAFSRDIAERFD